MITTEFAAGRMSYAKVRALTRIATAETETDLAQLVPDGLADKFDLDLAIWAAFANARIDRERRQQQHEHQLAA
jgi:hypothetical protein